MPKYNSIENIPARCFFEILKTKNYQLLRPKSKEKGLEEVFMSIYDDFFLHSDNEESKNYLRLNNEIAFLKYKIATLKQALHFYYYNKTTKEMRQNFLDALYEHWGIFIDIDADFDKEVNRVLSHEIEIIENDLKLAQMDFDKMIKQSQSKDYNYFDDIGVLSQILTGNSLLKEDMTLAVYVALNKVAKKVVEQQNKKK